MRSYRWALALGLALAGCGDDPSTLCVTHRRLLVEANKEELRRHAEEDVAHWLEWGRSIGIPRPSCPACDRMITAATR